MRLLGLVMVLVARGAWAHIHLDAPPSFKVTDAYGNPQKVEPCGEPGALSDAGVTTVTAGSPLTVVWHETIYHPGHFRLSLAEDAGALLTPAALVVNNNCESAPVEASPQLPTLVDGLFASHTGTMLSHQYTVTVPMVACERCVLQLMQFMSAHGPPCFYYQCAMLRIVMPDAGPPDAGPPDAGPPDAGVEDAGMEDAGAVDAGAPDAGPPDAGAVDAGPWQADAGAAPLVIGECGCSGSPADVVLLALAALALQLRWPRRSR